MQTPADSAIAPAPRTERGLSAVSCAAILAVVCLALFLWNARTLPLTDPDESRCALIVRDMIQNGRWLVPHLSQEPYFDKPAPFFWLAAAVQWITGEEEVAGRAVAALAALAAVLCTFTLARRLHSTLAGLLAGLVQATTVEFLYIARWYRMDMPFTAAMWAALCWFALGEIGPADQPPVTRNRRWLGFYICCAIATLFKGPAGLALPLGIVLLYLLLSGRPLRVLDAARPLGLAAFFLIAAPFYVVASLREPGYFHEFFIRQNFQRFAGSASGPGNLGHEWPGIVVVVILLIGLMPWTNYLAGVFVRYFPRRWRDRAQRPVILLLWLASLATTVFFAFSQTKLINYLLPAFPPLAVMTGMLLADWTGSRERDLLMWLGARSMALLVLILAAGVAGFEYWLHCLDGWIAVPLAGAALCSWRMFASLRKDRRVTFAGWAVAAVVFIYAFLIVHTAPPAYGLMSVRQLARLVPPGEVTQADFSYWGDERFSFQYYTRAASVTRYRPSRPEDLEDLVRRLSSSRPTYCLVCGPKHLDQLKGTLAGGLRILGQDGECWLLGNVPAGPPDLLRNKPIDPNRD